MSIATMIARGHQTLTHERPSISQDAGGNRSRTWTGLATAVPCWRQSASARLRLAYAQRQLVVSHAIYVEADLDCHEGDRMRIGSTYYLVRGWLGQGSLGKLWRIDAEEVR